MFKAMLARGEHLARVEANRAILRFVNGIDWLIRDPMTVVGQTPYDVVFKKGKLEVRHYHHKAAAIKPRFEVPILMVPPLMVKPFIFDLFPGRSLVSFCLERGFDVFLVDFGEPDRADGYVTLDDYVLNWIPAACSVVRESAGIDALSLFGYCMGGLFALSYSAVQANHGVRNIVSVAAPVDTHQMGLFAWVLKHAGGQVELLARQIGNVPGGLSSTVFRLLTPAKNLTRYADLFMNLWNREYINGFDATNQWVGQFIDYPQEAFQQFLSDFMIHNKLAKGMMTFGGQVADLGKVDASLLAFAGRTDSIAPPAAVRAVLNVVGGADKEVRLAPGGHIGVFAGSQAPGSVWKPATEWLAHRSDRQRAPLRVRARTAKPRKRSEPIAAQHTSHLRVATAAQRRVGA